MTEDLKLLYEGKAKKVFDYTQNKVIIRFKDDVTAFNGVKKDNLPGKGKINKKISSFFFKLLEKNSVKTHWIDDIDETSFLAKKIDIVPLEVVVRNYAAGSFCKRYGIESGTKFSKPLVEFFLKDDDLNDPLITEDAAIELGLAKESEIKSMKNYSLKINKIISDFLKKKGVLLVDYKLEFGRFGNEIVLGDEISPDTCRFWDMETMKSLDKDVYRNSTGDLVSVYEIFEKRIGLE
jgi:phosphoribosylaminoimidazole-succinocarboxamide synthase